MIASASDDTTIKIWGTKLEAEQQQRYLEEKEAKAIAEDKKSQSRFVEFHGTACRTLYWHREQEGTSTSPSSDQETISESMYVLFECVSCYLNHPWGLPLGSV